MVHVIPLGEQDIESHCLNGSTSISGIRLGGGMNYAEVLLHRFGIIGPDGGLGKGLCKSFEKLQAGPLATIFKTTPPDVDHSEDGMKQCYLIFHTNIFTICCDFFFVHVLCLFL
ncbi:hypothetical protein HN51_016123 [Arachis hypogaea]